MDELAKSYQILGITPPVSEAQLKEIYRDLVNVWHPDRFHHSDRLREKAQEKLKEINGAYQVVLAEIFTEKSAPRAEPTASSPPPPRPDTREEAPVPARGHRGLWTAFVAGAVVMLGAGLLFYPRKGNPDKAAVPVAAAAAPNLPDDSVPDPMVDSNAASKSAVELVREMSAPTAKQDPSPTIKKPSADVLAQSAALTRAYAALAVASKDYKGHRVKAMKEIETAAKPLGLNLNDDGKGQGTPGTSDDQLRAAQALLEQALAIGKGTSEKNVNNHIESAIKHINLALR